MRSHFSVSPTSSISPRSAIYRRAITKLEGHSDLAGSVERMYLRRRCFDGSLNNTIVKPRVAAAANAYTSDFTDVKFCVAAIMIAEEAIRFRHLDCNPDRAQKLISLSMSRHLSTSNISSKSMHAFLSNLANRQTDRQTNKRGQTHLPPALSEVNKYSSKLATYRHGRAVFCLGTEVDTCGRND